MVGLGYVDLGVILDVDTTSKITFLIFFFHKEHLKSPYKLFLKSNIWYNIKRPNFPAKNSYNLSTMYVSSGKIYFLI